MAKKQARGGTACWYEGMNHMQLVNALAVKDFPHGKQQKKEKRSH